MEQRHCEREWSSVIARWMGAASVRDGVEALHNGLEQCHPGMDWSISDEQNGSRGQRSRTKEDFSEEMGEL